MIVLLTVLQARAWTHIGFLWAVKDAPIRVLVDPTMPHANAWLAAFQTAGAAWTSTPTQLALSVEMADTGPLSLDSSPGDILVLRDPDDLLLEGAPATAFSYSSGDVAWAINGQTYLYMDEADIVLSPTVTFVSSDEPCEGDDDVREIIATHELGHALGMGHSCEQEDFCEDELLASAVMYWNPNGCMANAVPNADDFDGLGQLYDAAGTWFVTSGDEIGATSREICFAAEPNGIVADHVAWDFGDGATALGDATCHTFETPGEFDVEATFFSEPDDDAPRSWGQPIVACGPPAPLAGAEHLFDVDTIGTQIEIHPTVDALYPCVTSVRWSVLRDGETLFDLPTSTSLVDVGEYGAYDVVLTVDGYGGVATEEQTVTLAADDDAGGCSTARPRGGLVLLGFAMAALYGRRTRPESGHGARNSSQIGAR